MTSNERSRRSSAAQLAAMRRQWPDFTGIKTADGTLCWKGPLRPKAQFYEIFVFWKPGVMALPYVMLDDPRLSPRRGGTYAEIPHLLFDQQNPKRSGLCLFDPAGHEWSDADLIAETTLFWASEWLAYYELWHLTGEWLAPGVGYESVARMHAAEARAVQELRDNVH